MFGIPGSCKIDNTIFKKMFYDNGDLGSADKELFTKGIDKIVWRYCLKPETIHIKPYKDEIREYPEIEVIEVALSEEVKIKRIAEIVMRTIPYPMILLFTLNGKTQIWTAHQRVNQNDSAKNTLEDFISTGWLDKPELFDVTKLDLTNFFTLYSGIVDVLSIHNARAVAPAAALTGELARALTAKLETLDAQMAGLRSKLKKEQQFNRKMELNLEIKKLEAARTQIQGGTPQ